jgi:hypothetical protein
MGFVLLPILDDPYFDEVIAQLSERCLVNTDWNEVIRNYPKWLAQLQTMQPNRLYAIHVVVFDLQVLGKSLESNPDHDQEVQSLKYYNYSSLATGEWVGDLVVWNFLEVVATII